MTAQPIPYPQSCPSVKYVSLQFGNKDVVWYSVKCTEWEEEGLESTVKVLTTSPYTAFLTAVCRLPLDAQGLGKTQAASGCRQIECPEPVQQLSSAQIKEKQSFCLCLVWLALG